MLSKKNKQLSTFLPIMIWFIACLFYTYQYFLRISISGLETQLVKNFHFDAITLSNVAGAFFYAFILMQIPAGILINRYGNKRMLMFAAFCCSLGCFFFAFVHGAFLLEAGRFLMGIGGAFGLTITLSLSHNWFTEREFVLLNGLTRTVGSLGAILGGIPLMLLIQVSSIETIMLFGGIIGIILVLITWIGVYDSPEHLTKKHKPIHWKYTFKSIGQILRNKEVWLASLYTGALYAPIPTFAVIWGTPFLMAKYHISAVLANTASTTIFVGLGVGSLMVAWVSNLMHDHVKTMRIGSFTALIITLIIFYVPHIPLALAFVLILLLGLSLSCASLGFITVRNNVEKKNNAIAFSIAYMFQILGGTLSLPLIGWLLEVNWAGNIVHNVRIYHLPNYHIALMIIPTLIAASLILSFIMKKDRQE